VGGVIGGACVKDEEMVGFFSGVIPAFNKLFFVESDCVYSNLHVVPFGWGLLGWSYEWCWWFFFVFPQD
jgi:hypothetical protein